MSDVVIVGTGVISVAGLGADRILHAMTTQANFFEPTMGTSDDSDRLPWPISRVSPDDISWPNDDPWWINNQKFASVSARWAVSSAAEAIQQSGRAIATAGVRSGVVVAVPSGEEEAVKVIPKLAALSRTDPRPLATLLYEEVPDYSYVRGIPSQTGQFIAKLSGFLGSNVAVFGESGAGGLSAVSLALRLLDSEELDRVIVVGVAPPLSPSALVQLDRADPLGTNAASGCGPFDAKRAGILVGQGAAAIVFEKKDAAFRRGIKPLAVFSCCDTVSASSVPAAIGSAADLVLTKGSRPPDVWFAHGTGSLALDEMLCRTIGSMVRAATTSTRGTIGTAFECAGLIDIAVAVEALNREIVPPVGLLQNPDPALGDIDFVVTSARRVPGLTSVLVTASGHGGSATMTAGAALITRSAEEQ
jgi:3-oxoacyl-[acyl-carrier-protein] synthase II